MLTNLIKKRHHKTLRYLFPDVSSSRQQRRLQSQWLGSYWLHFRSKTSPFYLLDVIKYRPILKP
jgi:hypothetical protein